jgi:hypothetical protein
LDHALYLECREQGEREASCWLNNPASVSATQKISFHRQLANLRVQGLAECSTRPAIIRLGSTGHPFPAEFLG